MTSEQQITAAALVPASQRRMRSFLPRLQNIWTKPEGPVKAMQYPGVNTSTHGEANRERKETNLQPFHSETSESTWIRVGHHFFFSSFLFHSHSQLLPHKGTIRTFTLHMMCGKATMFSVLCIQEANSNNKNTRTFKKKLRCILCLTFLIKRRVLGDNMGITHWADLSVPLDISSRPSLPVACRSIMH